MAMTGEEVQALREGDQAIVMRRKTGFGFPLRRSYAVTVTRSLKSVVEVYHEVLTLKFNKKTGGVSPKPRPGDTHWRIFAADDPAAVEVMRTERLAELRAAANCAIRACEDAEALAQALAILRGNEDPDIGTIRGGTE